MYFGQRLNKAHYPEIMTQKVREGQYSVEAAKTILEEAGVRVTRSLEMDLLDAETAYLNQMTLV